jgi:hypothetical protein
MWILGKNRGRSGPIVTRITLGLILIGSLSGCAIHYYDETTGVEHLIGFGHMKMRVQEPNEGVRAVATETRTLGAAAGTTREGAQFSLGSHRSTRVSAVDENTSVTLARPRNGFINTRVGSLPPWLSVEDKERISKIVDQKGDVE